MTTATWSGLPNAAALRWNVASVKRHAGDAVCQMSRAKSLAMCLVASAAAFGREVVLVPPRLLGGRRQRRLAGCLAADQVPAHRHHRPAALRPERGHDVGRPRTPVEAAHDRLLDAESVHQRDRVDGQHGLLPVPRRIVGEETRRAVPPEVGDDHAVPGRGERGRDVGVAVDVVGPAVQQQHCPPAGRPDVDVADVEHARGDPLHRTERLGGRCAHLMALTARTMTAVTSAGCVAGTACEASISVISLPARLAMSRSACGWMA